MKEKRCIIYYNDADFFTIYEQKQLIKHRVKIKEDNILGEFIGNKKIRMAEKVNSTDIYSKDNVVFRKAFRWGLHNGIYNLYCVEFRPGTEKVKKPYIFKCDIIGYDKKILWPNAKIEPTIASYSVCWELFYTYGGKARKGEVKKSGRYF